MTYKKDSKLTFGITGTLVPGDRTTVQVGCQRVPLVDVVRLASEFSVSTEGALRADGITGTADGSGMVTFEGSTRTFSEVQIRDVARNLVVVEPEPAEPTWQAGDSAFIEGRGTFVRQASGAWRMPNGNQWHDADDWLDWYKAQRVTVLVKGGKVVGSEPAKPDPATLSWQDGDRIESINGSSRTRRNGRWYEPGSTGPSGWGDAEWDSYLERQARANPSNPRWRAVRKGGVDLAA